MKPIAIETDTERLELAIRRAGLHKYQAANRADMNATILSQILNGSRLPSRAECDALAEATGLAVMKLFPDTLQIHEDAEREAASSPPNSAASGGR